LTFAAALPYSQIAVPDTPAGYREVPEEDRKKAQVFFGHGDTKAAMGQYAYAIDMYLDGLRLDPDAVEAHRKLREVSLKYKASGGKGLGMFDAMKLKKPTKDDKENLFNAEKLLTFDPGNRDQMLSIAQNAWRAGYFDTVVWIAQVLTQAEADSGKPDVNKFIALKDLYREMGQFQLAADLLDYALRIKPHHMDWQTEAKNLRAQQTVRGAGYDKGGSFRDQVRDMKGQLKLMDADKEIPDADMLTRQLADAEAELAADPNEVGKVRKLVDVLRRTEKPELEERAVKLLQEWYDKTRQFNFRKAVGEIRIKQMQRQARVKQKTLADTPESKADFTEFKKKQIEFELSELILWAQAYPTEKPIKYEIGKRQFMLKQFDDAIASFQEARGDPKFRVDATIHLGLAFLEAGFLDEADETLNALIKDYPHREGEKFKEMNYWRGRVLEQKGQNAEAIKHYSQIFQLESSYRDVAARIKRLRTAPPPTDGGGDTNL
jgi:tetratricopeptide (TPR) repeat protein